MKKIFYLFLLGLFISANCFAQESSTDEWLTYEKDNYSIDYPADWQLNKSGFFGVSFILSQPLTSEKDQFSENINLYIQDLSDNKFSLNDFIDINKNKISSSITESEIITDERSENGNYHKLVYLGKQSGFHFKFTDYIWVKDNNAYVLTLTAEKDEFDNFKEVGFNVLNSFKFN